MAHADELVLEGAQGTFKSSVFALLGGEWYTNDIAALGTKDAQEQIIGIWIVELDEMEAVTLPRRGCGQEFCLS